MPKDASKTEWDLDRNSTLSPIRLPIVSDGTGRMPRCPSCGKIPYDFEQCQFCGQHFLQDDEIQEYARIVTKDGACENCGAPVTIYISKYNGDDNYICPKCLYVKR